MNDPIISPWFIYLADMCTGVRLVLCTFTIFFTIGTVVNFIQKGAYFKFCAITAILSCTMFLLTPSTRTVYKMLLVNNISKQTLHQGIDAYEKLKQDLINGILIIKGGEKCNHGN